MKNIICGLIGATIISGGFVHLYSKKMKELRRKIESRPIGMPPKSNQD